MNARRWVGWLLLLAGGALALSFFVLSFLSEPSATGRIRTALYFVGIGLAVIGVATGVAILWMLLRRPLK